MKPHLTKTYALAALVLAMSLVLPHVAFAAPATVSQYDVRIVNGSDGSRELLAAVQLAPGTQLPAQVVVPIPKGARVDWVGEILGGDPAKDPKVQYGTDEQADVDNVVFTLTKALRGQVEARVPGSPEPGRAGLSWKAPIAAVSVQVGVQVPAGATVTSATVGATTVSGGDGSSFYVKQYKNVKAGQRLEVKAEYSGGSSTGSGSGGSPQAPNSRPVQPQSSGALSTGRPSSPLVAVLALGVILAGTFYALDKVGGSQHHAEPDSRRQED